MAKLVCAHAVSHTPVMINFPGAIPDDHRNLIYDAFKRVGNEIKAARPDAIVVISDDHLHNFFLNNFPAFCFGAADHYPTPVEHWLKTEKTILPGDSMFGSHLLGEALEAGFDPSFSMELTLDHGTITPLSLAGIGNTIPVVPLLVNCVQPPLPKMRRCIQLGRFLAEAIASYDGAERIAILATGGISHDVGTPRMGMVNETFDHEFVRLLSAGDDDALIAYSTDHVNEAGNGAEEIRNWLIAYGAAGNARFEQICYQAEPNWYTGICLGRWNVGA